MAPGRHLVAAHIRSVGWALPLLFGGSPLSLPGQARDPVSLIIRSDDAGMSHSVNMALQRLIDSGLPVSVSVMFACPWYQETVAILKRHPAVAVGIHLTLNSEWKNYRLGRVSGREAIPTLVDADGYFFQSSEALYQNHPDLRQIEKELRVQIERALRSGLKIDYVDYHMGTAVRYPEFRDLTERLAREFRPGMWGYFGETMDNPQYWAAPRSKADSIVAFTGRLKPGAKSSVTHVGSEGSGLAALAGMSSERPLP